MEPDQRHLNAALMMPQGDMWHSWGKQISSLLGGVNVITKEADAKFLRGILFALILATVGTGAMAAIATSKAGPAVATVSAGL